MADIDIDFEGTSGNGNNGQAGNGNQSAGGATTGNEGNTGNADVTDLNGGGTADLTSGANNGNQGSNNNQGSNTNQGGANNGNADSSANNGDTNNNGQEGADGNSNTSSTGELKPGDKLEFDNATYTVSQNGDIVDDKGQVFKKANEVKDWLSSLEQEEDALSIDAIQEALGTEIIDEAGNKVEYTNDAAGVKAYVDAVLELKSKELQEGAINKLYSDNPLLKQFQDYVTVNGSPIGFGELPDRDGIIIDKENLAQQEAIIRMAAKEFGNKSLNDNYIKYLKDTGSLYDEAVNQLAALQEQDKTVREEYARRAEAARMQEQQELNDYWNNVNNVIKSRTIAGYKLPESFVKEVNGKKQTLTPDDFYNYLSRQTEVDANGNRITAYQKDLNDESNEDLLNRELLSAWLMYTGGTYKDLIGMAAKEEQVRTLKLRSKQRSTGKTVKVIKPATGKVDYNELLLG